MAITLRSVGAATLHRKTVYGSDAKLSERKKERAEQDVSTRTYTGTLHIRVFDCPKDLVDTALAGDLALGTVLPVVWGGVSTSKAGDPRLQRVKRIKQPTGGMQRLQAEYLEINTR